MMNSAPAQKNARPNGQTTMHNKAVASVMVKVCGNMALYGLDYARVVGVKNNRALAIKAKNAHRGARTHDHKVKSLALYRLS